MWKRMCAECVHGELQCPPILNCKAKNIFRYLDSPACELFEEYTGEPGEEGMVRTTERRGEALLVLGTPRETTDQR